MANKELATDAYHFLETDAGRYLWSIIQARLDSEVDTILRPYDPSLPLQEQFVIRELHIARKDAIKSVLDIKDELHSFINDK